MVERQVQSVGDFFQERVDTLIHQIHSCKPDESVKLVCVRACVCVCTHAYTATFTVIKFLNCRQCIQKSCRNFKELFVDMRERIVKTLGLAKLLRKVNYIKLYSLWACGEGGGMHACIHPVELILHAHIRTRFNWELCITCCLQ